MASGPKNDLQAEFVLDDDSASSSNGSGDRTTAKAAARRVVRKGGDRPSAAKAPVDESEVEGAEASGSDNMGAAGQEAASPAPGQPAPEPPDTTPGAEEAQGESPEATEGPTADAVRVLRYVIDAEGGWKELEDGSRVPLSEAEWRNALARHFRRDTPAST